MDDKILNAPVRSTLVTMAAPAAFGMLMTFLFQLIDTYFVGKLGTKPLAAMSYAYPVYFFLMAFFMGAATGVSSSVARALGEQRIEKARQLTTISILSFVLLTFCLAGIGLVFIDDLFLAVGANTEILPMVKIYMMPLFFGMFALIIGLIGNAALMAKGVMIRSTVVMAIGGIVNVVFDYLLIFGIGFFPELGLAGAANATVLSWLVIAVLMMGLIVRESLFSLAFLRDIRTAISDLKGVMVIAGPAIAAQILTPIAIAVITRSVAQYGDDAVAAFGIVTRVESLILVGILSLSVVMTPFVAQNYGAKKWLRLDQTVANAGRLTVYWGLLAFAAVALLSEQILGIFSQSSNVIALGSPYFWIVGISFPSFGLLLITTSFFNGVQAPRLSLQLTVIKSLILTIPLALIGALWSLEAIWVALAVANLLGSIYAYKVLNRWLLESGSKFSTTNVLADYRSDFRFLK